uniref:Uncharacterized protein n=1 Tax=Timema shepardi TaxID=629360 RepID=A0A7R9B7G1_TIMSH|nr:unnamed protein product [Timema shepardi]
MSIIPGLDEEVECRDSDFFHRQRANLSRVSTATPVPAVPSNANPVPATETFVPIIHPVSFPASVTTATLVSYATSPPIPIQTFPLSHPPVSLPVLEPVPSGSSSQQLQWFPTAEESPASVSLGPSSPAEKLIQPQECFSTPISVGSVQRRRTSNSAHLGEELRLKLEKESEILELRLQNERERNRVAARHEEELHNIAVKNLHAAQSHQDVVNKVLLEKAQLEREPTLRLLQHHPLRQ